MSPAEPAQARRPSPRAPGARRAQPAAGDTSGRRAWPAAVGMLLAGALVLRVWGHTHGLPYVYNADENAHFVARAIGMFGHTYNPNYFVNPPGFTYLLHALFWLRWGGEEVQAVFARDAGEVFGYARLASAVLGTLAVGLLVAAGTRLLGRATGLFAGLLLAVAFLPVHYSHFALNDVPTLAPVCLCLLAIAGVLRRGHLLDYLLAGAALGVAVGMKYTAGIVVLALVAAGLASARRECRLMGLGLAGAAALGAFVVVNPFAVADFGDFLDGLRKQSAASSDGGGKLGLTQDNGFLYYLWTLTWGLGWIPLLLSGVGALALALRDRRVAWVLVPAVLAFWLFMGQQDRFFARWMLPVYPLLCLLAAHGAWVIVQAVAARFSRRVALAAAGAAAVALAGQGLVHSIHNDVVLAREDTRQLARDWMVANVPEGAKVVVEPVAPDQWAMDPGAPSEATGTGNRWNKWPTSRSLIRNDGTRITSGRGRIVKLEDYERTTRPELVGAYARGGYCWVLTGSTQYGRAFAEPEQVPRAIDYYEELERRGDVVFHADPYDSPGDDVSFSFDFSFNAYPLAYARPGPEIFIYRLREAACAETPSTST